MKVTKTDYKVWPPGGGPRKLESELTREEALWDLRGAGEATHRLLTYRNSVILTYCPWVRDIANLPEMGIDDFRDTCNKSVPIYILPSFDYYGHLLIALHNYVYRRWFRPYRSELGRLRLFCKFVTLQGQLEMPRNHPPVNTLISMNDAICTNVQGVRQKYIDLAATAPQSAPRGPWIIPEV